MATTNGPTFYNDLKYVRRGGSGFTVFVFGGIPIAFAQQVSHQAPKFVNSPSFIQPMDEPYVVEILTPIAAGVGTLVLNLYDLWGNNSTNGSKIWDRLGNSAGYKGSVANGSGVLDTSGTGQGYTSTNGGGIFANSSDIVDIALVQAQASPSQTQIVQYIRQIPSQGAGVSSTPQTSGGQSYYMTYNNCTITDVRDDETVQVGTLEIIKQITVNYTYASRSGGESTNYALSLRNNPI